MIAKGYIPLLVTLMFVAGFYMSFRHQGPTDLELTMKSAASIQIQK